MVGSRWSVGVGPALRIHVVVVFDFLFFPVPVVVVFCRGLKSTYPDGVPSFARACTVESSW